MAARQLAELIGSEFLGWCPWRAKFVCDALASAAPNAALWTIVSFAPLAGEPLKVFPGSSIAAAIALCPKWGIVTLMAGEHDIEDIVVIDKPLTIRGGGVPQGIDQPLARGDHGQQATRIRVACGGRGASGSALSFADGCRDAMLCDIDFFETPMTCSGGTPTISRCTVTSHKLCVEATNNTRVTLRDCWIRGDGWDSGATGVLIADEAVVHAVNCHFDDFLDDLADKPCGIYVKDRGHCHVELCRFESIARDAMVRCIPPATVQLQSFTYVED
ncbi:unnamed protein product [Symbiodinium natans]|uniref:Right handed beta helix domain-containing protein n=1 Tax=Symbiodinium natans TaxID=878477 RepID=A0A812QZG7_9DINO|nr:unnamed protein product [Symbiodinium natans]